MGDDTPNLTLRRPPTITDVARAAGVSPMTVSRVINADAKVRPETRAKVDEAVARLNYKPNPAARSLAGAELVRVGLLYSNPSAAYLSEFLVGMLDQASRADVQLVIEKCDPGGDELVVARHLIDGGVHGLILPPPLCDSQAVLAALAERDVPAVVVATGHPPAAAAAVTIDDRGAGLAMTRHLIALGHRRIGFIIGNPNQTASAERLAGYRAALAEAGIGEDQALIAQGMFTYRSGLDAAEQLLAAAERPTAIFASNDDMAAAAVAVAHRHGIDVPGDLTVCGFDDTAIATTIWPELTTIRQPIAEMSRAALELLVAAIRSRRSGEAVPPAHKVLDFELVRRQSDAPPRVRPRSG
ncbi:MAG: LacI family DNA-binding transcriptional regulator [Sphingomonas sp.]